MTVIYAILRDQWILTFRKLNTHPHTSKYYKNIFHIQRLKYFPRLFFWRRHCCSNCGNMCVIPSVVIHNHGSVCHSCSLISIIPPWCHLYRQKNYVQGRLSKFWGWRTSWYFEEVHTCESIIFQLCGVLVAVDLCRVNIIFNIGVRINTIMPLVAPLKY